MLCPSPGQHLVCELVSDGLLLLHGLRPLVNVHGEVVRRGDGTPADIFWRKIFNLDEEYYTIYHLLVVDVLCVLFWTQPACMVRKQNTSNI